MRRCVVNVATGSYVKGQRRLAAELATHEGCNLLGWTDALPPGCPPHFEVAYAFKAHALKEASRHYNVLLWADACILPIRSLEPLWERIERDGYWFSRNGFSNYEWTADSAYPDLFAAGPANCFQTMNDLQFQRSVNKNIDHVVATTFGLNVRHEKGKAFLEEYYRLASETRAFCGPWINSNALGAPKSDGVRCAPCGPPDVRGHRHDQSAASVIAWRLGFELTAPPSIFSYKGGETEDTILIADGAYE